MPTTAFLRVHGALRGCRRVLTKRVALWSVPALLGASLAAAPVPAAAVAQTALLANVPTVDVTGSSLANIVTSPLTLTPAFDPTITDYVLRCQTGTNTIRATLVAAGGTIGALGSHGASIDIQQDLVENEALVITARAQRRLGENQRAEEDGNGRVQYWIRCLPHDFPPLSVTKPGNPPPGWYLTSNLFAAASSSTYSMVLDNHGTPVWYEKSAVAAWDVTPLPDGTIAWADNGVFQDYDLRTQTTRVVASPDLYLDLHELRPLPNGDVMVLSYAQRSNMDLSALGLGSSANINDCVIEELDPQGQIVWRWRASDHISPAESLHQPLGAADIYHCNSIDIDNASGHVLLSSRHTDAVYLIEKTTGKIIWKMGGNPQNHDGAQILTISGDPEGVFHAQHFVRFRPNGDVSLYDDQSWNPGLAARGVEYHINAGVGTATLVWSYQSPDSRNSLATGSFERLNGGTDNVVAWGIKPDSPVFTEVDAQGHVMLSVGFPNGLWSYRVIKVPVAALDHGFLRATAGLPQFVRPMSPKISFVGSLRGSVTGGASVTITGTGLTGATAVRFGPNPALKFVVNNDSSITATVPPGNGVVGVTVTTSGGTTAIAAGNALTPIDSDFEGDVGSWRSADSFALTTGQAQSGAYSLQLSPTGTRAEAVASGRYAVPAGATAKGSEWVITPKGPHRVRAFIAFYDSSGSLISVAKGPLVTTTSTAWTLVAEATVSPDHTTSAALGFEDDSGAGGTYLDTATLVGSTTFAYQSNDESAA